MENQFVHCTNVVLVKTSKIGSKQNTMKHIHVHPLRDNSKIYPQKLGLQLQ